MSQTSHVILEVVDGVKRFLKVDEVQISRLIALAKNALGEM